MIVREVAHTWLVVEFALNSQPLRICKYLCNSK